MFEDGIGLKHVIIGLGAVVLLIAIAFVVANSIMGDSEESVEMSPAGEIIETNGDVIRYLDGNSSQLIRDLSNCYYDIYSSDLLKRNETFDIEEEVRKHVSEFQQLVPTALWVDYYDEQCSSIIGDNR